MSRTKQLLPQQPPSMMSNNENDGELKLLIALRYVTLCYDRYNILVYLYDWGSWLLECYLSIWLLINLSGLAAG